MKARIIVRRSVLMIFAVCALFCVTTMWSMDMYKNSPILRKKSANTTQLLLSPSNDELANYTLPSKTEQYIQIIAVVTDSKKLGLYQHALDSMKCYARIQNYPFLVVPDWIFGSDCRHKDKFFRRHCVVAGLLDRANYTLFIDADMGVVNPKRKIEDFIDDRFDITFYDRFFNYEVTSGTYLVKNTDWSRKFLKGWADYEYRLPNSMHGTDNGALHAYLAEVIFPKRPHVYENCMRVYNRSESFEDLFTFEVCIRAAMGASEEFGQIRILTKGTGWARDNWLTNSRWSPDRDFIIHGWKLNQLVSYSRRQLPLSTTPGHISRWFNPLAGPIVLNKCSPSNRTWTYDPNLISSAAEINTSLAKTFEEVERSRYYYLSRVTNNGFFNTLSSWFLSR